jgi:tetratricopeptide (TPR) repeat protein
MNYKTNILLALVLIIGLSACQNSPKKSAETTEITEVNKLLTNITIDALKNNDYPQAKRSIHALILSNDDKVWKFIQSAIISLPKELSMEIVESALQIDTVNSSSSQLFSIAKIFISYQNTEDALSTINKSIALDENNILAKYWRARLYTVMKNYVKAEIDFQYITNKEPDNEEYSAQYASFLQETKQFEKAQSVLAKHNVTPDSIFKRIIFALQNKNNELANSLYPDLKNYEVDEASSNHKHFLIAEAAYWLKNYPDSEIYYRKVSGGDHYLDARDMLSLILFNEKRYDDSIEILHQLQNAEEQYAIKAYRLESQIYKSQDHIDEAISTLTRSLKLIPNNPILLYDRAMLYESQDQIDEAEKDLKQVIKDDPENFEALNALGYTLADNDVKLDEAYEYIKKAIELSPDDPAIIDSLGWVQYKLGKYAEAEINFNKAIESNINDSELYIHQYKTLMKLDKKQEAQELLQKAKTLFPENQKIIDLIKE